MEFTGSSGKGKKEREEVKLKLKTLKAVIVKCKRTLEDIKADGLYDDDDDGRENCHRALNRDHKAEQLCNLIKSKLEGPDFLERIESAQLSVQQNHSGEEVSSWDMVNDNDLWEDGNIENEQEEYVVVRQEDIVDGIACFMAAYLLSLKQTKDLTPNQLQEVLSKTFSIKKTKGKLQKALDKTKVLYNVASWSATAIGIYQNPALLGAATTAFWTSCCVISRLF